MSEHSLTFDASANSLDAVQRAAYCFSDRLSSEVTGGEKVIDVVLHITADDADHDALIADFRNEVLDQVLRERIRAETEDVRRLALALAFSKTGLAEPGV